MIIKIVKTKECCPYEEKYGKHFNQKLCEYAISLMHHEGKRTMSKDLVDTLLAAHGITLQNNHLWDYIYVANMASHDYLGSSIVDDKHLALFIKDYIDDEDGYDEIAFTRWKADMKAKNIDINWELMM